MRNLPPHELYALKLQCLDYGYALFEPNPNGAYDFVRVGDVGYVSEDGKFMKLFNAFSESDSPENMGSRFPEGFIPIAETYREQDRLEPLTPGCRRSEGVRTIGGNLAVSGPASQFIAGGSLTLSCSSGAGAALITKYRGMRHKALATIAMESYMIDNCASWVDLTRNLGRSVEMQDLVFVRECVLTGDWANISWNSTACDTEIDFSLGLPSAVSVGLSFWGQWQQHVTVPKRQGPLRESLTPDGEVPVLDQCTFLKGMRIAERPWYTKLRFLIPIESSSTIRKKYVKPSTLKVLADGDFKLATSGESNSPYRTIQNAYDALAIYIFENSEAHYALIDDNDLFSLSLYKSSTLNEICQTLLKLGSDGPSIELTSRSGVQVGRIIWKAKKLDLSQYLQSEQIRNIYMTNPNLYRKEVPVKTIESEFARENEASKLSPKAKVASLSQHPIHAFPPPPPPSPSSLLGANGSYISDLHNYKARHRGKKIEMIRKLEGKAHKPSWTTVCTIDGQIYGQSTKGLKKKADDEAASQALSKLYDENPSAFAYLPSFRRFLKAHNLADRVSLSYKEVHRDPSRRICTIHRDGKFLAEGVGSNKKEAADQAARNAEKAWGTFESP